VRKVMHLANRTALQRGSEFVDVADVLLGLLEEGSGNAIAALTSLGCNLRDLQMTLSNVVSIRAAKPCVDRLPQNESVKQLVQHAIEEAKSLKNNYVGTEHLLLALFRQDYWKQFLQNCGLLYDKAREQILRQQGQLRDNPTVPAVAPADTTQRILTLVRRIDWDALEKLCGIYKVVRQLEPLGAVWQMAMKMSEQETEE